MKNNFIAFLLLTLGTTPILAQIKGEAEYLVKYDLEFILDSTNREDVKHEVHRLYTGPSTSYYVSDNKFYRDSTMAILREEYKNAPPGSPISIGSNASSLPVSNFNSSVFKDLNNSEVWVQNLVGRDEFRYKETNTPLEWVLTEETKQIEQYNTIKATTSHGGRDYEAWFTPELPILDGPYVFSGLPGLVIEIYDTDRDYHFNLISLVLLKDSYSINSDNVRGKIITKKKFMEVFKRDRENPSARFSTAFPSGFETTDASGKTITLKDIERSVKESEAKRNNHIEIW